MPALPASPSIGITCYWSLLTFLFPLLFCPLVFQIRYYIPVISARKTAQSLSSVWLFVTPWTAACRLPCSSPTPRAFSSSCPSSWWCHLTPSHSLSFPSPPAFNLFQHQDFSNESVLCVRWPKYWNFCFSISPSNEYAGLIYFGIDRCDLLAIQETLKSVLQHHSSKHQFFGA